MIELNKHIEILLLSNDCVIVPDFGGFMAHYVDARKDSADGSFLPPKRNIGFNPKLVLNDSLLAQSYVEAYDISYPEATMRIEDEVRELKQRIEAEGSYEFNGIGTISLNHDGNYEFSPCEAGILTPSLYGLGSFKIKTTADIKKAVTIPAKAVDLEPRKAADEQRGHTARFVALWRNVAVACIAVILFLIIPSPLTKNVQMAGNQIDTSLLDHVLPKNVTTGQELVYDAVKKADAKVQAKVPVKGTSDNEGQKQDMQPYTTGYYSIVVASHVTLKNANAYTESLKHRGIDNAVVYRKKHVQVLMGKYADINDAKKVLNKINDKAEFAGAWITHVE